MKNWQAFLFTNVSSRTFRYCLNTSINKASTLFRRHAFKINIWFSPSPFKANRSENANNTEELRKCSETPIMLLLISYRHHINCPKNAIYVSSFGNIWFGILWQKQGNEVSAEYIENMIKSWLHQWISIDKITVNGNYCYGSGHRQSYVHTCHVIFLAPLLLTCFNSNASMDMLSHAK